MIHPAAMTPRVHPAGLPGTDGAVARARWAGKRVLVTRLRFMGDAILSLPLLAALRQALPATELHYLAEPATLEMLGAQPEIAVHWTAPRGSLPMLGLARRLRGQHFAAVIDLFCNPRSALLVRATRAPVRIGEDRRVRRHAYTLARHLVPGRSALEQHLDAMRGLGLEPPAPAKPVLGLRDAERAAGAARWRGLGVERGVVLHLGATQPQKEWPLEHAVSLVRALASAGLPVVLTTAPRRPEPSRAVGAAVGGAAHLLPALPLREVLGVMATAAAVVSVDGALVHAAVGLGTPTVALFGPTDPRIWFPYADFGPYRVVRGRVDSGAGHASMENLAPASVLAALQSVLAGAGGSSPRGTYA